MSKAAVGVDAVPQATQPSAAAFTPRYSLYIAVLFGLISMLAEADRNLVAILLVPIQKDLHVGDAAMGALTGLSFTLVYATVALPMARLADRGVRRFVVAASVAVWSVMTALCGLAGGYATLLIARMGVASGEAATRPAQMSMIGDLFSSKRRGTALGIISFGAVVGIGGGGYVAAMLNEAYSWRAAFLALGLPGLLVALAFLLTVREPPRGAHDGGVGEPVSFVRSVRYLFAIPTFRRLVVGYMFVQLAFAVFLAWIPTFMIRVHGMSTADASIAFGLMTVPPLIGNPLAAIMSDRLAARGAQWRLYLMTAMIVLALPVIVLMLTAHDRILMIALMVVYAVTLGPVSIIAPIVGLDVVRARARGAMTAVLGFAASVIGGGVGPFLLGMLNDTLAKTYGDQALRYTLLSIPCALVFAGVMLLWTSGTAEADKVEAARSVEI